MLDFVTIVGSEWRAYTSHVSDWERAALPHLIMTGPRFGVWAPVYGNHGA